MIERLVLPEVREMLAEGDLATLGAVLNRWPPADLAGIVSALDDEERAKILRALEGSVAAATFEYLDLSRQERSARVARRGEGGVDPRRDGP